MTPSNHHVTSQLRQLIYYHLDCNLPNNALFIAGRLQAFEPRASEAAYLLALCHQRLGQLKAAYDCSKNAGSRGTHLGCSYIFAQVCWELGKYSEGVTALERSKSLWVTRNGWNRSTDVRRQPLPDAAAVNCLLAKLLTGYGDSSRAIECYAQAVKENPFMWDAFQGLCDSGAELNIPSIFKMTPEMLAALAGGSSEETPFGSLDDVTSHTTLGPQAHGSSDPFSATSRANGEARHNNAKSALFEKSNPSTNLFTPTGSMEILTDEIETPIAINGAGRQPTKLKEVTTSIREDKVQAEPPLAPTRRLKTNGTSLDWVTEAPPPRMKTSTLWPKPKFHEEAHDADPSHLTAPSSMFSSGITERKRTVSGNVAPSSTTSAGAQTVSTATDPMAPQRRSVRILNSLTRPQTKSYASSTISTREAREVKKPRPVSSRARTAHTTVGRVVSGNRKHDPMAVDTKEPRPAPTATFSVGQKSANAERVKEQESLQWLLDLFMKLGSGHFALSRYRCPDAFHILGAIPQGQRETPWVLAQLGRALFEQGQYADAEKYFARIKTMAHSRLEDMEIYSTILWHQKSEIDLSYLAHEAIETDRLSPQAWCVVGNAFSLQRDHDHALRCFQRATQLNPKFAYAFTLQGHEHAANEEYDQALAAYRRGLGADRRHYNAWYGLGRVFERQGKYGLAEQHYRSAAAINPTNAVLLCCIGTVLEKLRRPQPALEAYERSVRLAPRSSLARYRKARVLVAMARPDLALVELRELKDLAPDESNVHFLLGRVYKALRDKGNAIRHFTTALNLDPKVRSPPRAPGSFSLLTRRAGFPSHQRSHGGNRGSGRGGRHDDLIFGSIVYNQHLWASFSLPCKPARCVGQRLPSRTVPDGGARHGRGGGISKE